MNRKWLRRMAVPIIATCVGLANCSTSTTTSEGPPTAFAVLRLTAAGVPDIAFAGGRGIVTTEIDPALVDIAFAVAVEPAPSNKIIAAGSSGVVGQGVIALVRYNPDGTLDTTGFGTGGIVKTPLTGIAAAATAIAVQPDGKILVAALTFNASNNNTGIALIRYASSGALDATFNTSGTVPGIVTAAIGPGNADDRCALALQGTNIIVGGVSSDGKVVLQRYDTNGTADTVFANNVVTTTPLGAANKSPAIALQSTGKIVLASANSSDQVLLRYNTDGMRDTGFGPLGANGVVITNAGGVDFSNAVAVQSNDKIVVAGHAHVTDNTSDISLVRYTPDGALDTTFVGLGINPNPGVVITDLDGRFDNALALVLQEQAPNQPKIVISGNTGAAGFTQIAVLRYNPDGSLDTSFGPTLEGVVLVQVAGPSTVASGNAVALQPVANGVGIVVAGFD